MKKAAKYVIGGLAGLAVIGSAAAYLLWPESVDVVPAAKQDLTEYVREKGTIAANHKVDIYATVDGKLETVRYEVGDTVSSKDLLAEYHLTEFENAYEKATANVAYYTDEYDAAVAENNKAQARLNAAQTAAENYQNQYTDLQNQMNEIDVSQAREEETIQGQTKQLESAAAMLETELGSAESMKQTLKSEKDTLANEIASLEGTVSACKKQIADNRKKLEELKKKKADPGTVSESDSASDAEKALQEAIETAEAQRRTAQAQIDALEDRKDELDSQYASADDTVNNLTGQLGSNRAAMSNVPNEGMTGEETHTYLELAKNLSITTINWNASLTEAQAAKERLVTQETLDRQMDSVTLAQLDQKDAEQALEKAKTGIVCPCGGVIMEKQVDNGATVTAGQLLYTIQPTSGYKVTVGISRYDIGKIAAAQEAVITVGDLTYAGVVSKIYQVAETDSSGKAKVKVDIAIIDTENLPVIGLEADVRIITAQKSQTLSVPRKAVYSDDAGDYVYVLEAGRAVRKAVSLGVAGEDFYEVLDGITAGEKVITTQLSDDDIGRRLQAEK